ncbi:MAG TPA: hypothetical protein VGN01_12210 [Acidobacteriaceae bacterium]
MSATASGYGPGIGTRTGGLPGAQPPRRMVSRRGSWRLGWILAAALPVSVAQPSPDATPASLLSQPARAWAVDGANNEVLVIQHPDSYLRYRFHTVDEKGDRVRDQIETPEGSVARLIQIDGRALTQDEDRAERERLNDLVASPRSFAQHIRHEQENKKIGIGLLRMMPDAMLWSYTPGQPQLPHPATGEAPLVVLDFKPNPAWSPPNMEAEALTGLQGRVWIDSATRRVVRLEGNVFHAVNIGWGMIAHIYPGGTVTVEQTHAGGQRWIVTHIVEQLTVRALMVKNVKQRMVYDTSDLQPVQPMSYTQAIQTLLNTPLPAR